MQICARSILSSQLKREALPSIFILLSTASSAFHYHGSMTAFCPFCVGDGLSILHSECGFNSLPTSGRGLYEKISFDFGFLVNLCFFEFWLVCVQLCFYCFHCIQVFLVAPFIETTFVKVDLCTHRKLSDHLLSFSMQPIYLGCGRVFHAKFIKDLEVSLPSSLDQRVYPFGIVIANISSKAFYSTTLGDTLVFYGFSLLWLQRSFTWFWFAYLVHHDFRFHLLQRSAQPPQRLSNLAADQSFFLLQTRISLSQARLVFSFLIQLAFFLAL